MLVFIDESGDAGLKIEKGSSPNFVITLVVFSDTNEAQKSDDRISELRKSLGFRSDFEFHFNKLKPELRRIFLKSLCEFKFQYFSIVINKQKLHGKGFQYTGPFYKYACKLVCSNAKDYLIDATVIIDGRGSRAFKRQLANYLRNSVNDKKSKINFIKRVKVQDSHKNNLLQLADMVCGAVARSFKDKKDAAEYRGLIKKREVYVQFWPR